MRKGELKKSSVTTIEIKPWQRLVALIASGIGILTCLFELLVL